MDIRRIQFPRAHEDAKLLTLFTTISSGRKLSHAMDIGIHDPAFAGVAYLLYVHAGFPLACIILFQY